MFVTLFLGQLHTFLANFDLPQCHIKLKIASKISLLLTNERGNMSRSLLRDQPHHKRCQNSPGPHSLEIYAHHPRTLHGKNCYRFVAAQFAHKAGLAPDANISGYMRYAICCENKDKYHQLILGPYNVPLAKTFFHHLVKVNLTQQKKSSSQSKKEQSRSAGQGSLSHLRLC